MNKELIIKLIRLANNNQNENEANLAARKVCKLLAEHNWEGVSDTSRRQQVPPNPPNPPRQQYNPMYEYGFWDDLRWRMRQQQEEVRREYERKEEERIKEETHRRQNAQKDFWKKFGGY